MSALIPVDLEQHPPVPVECPDCGCVQFTCLANLYRDFAEKMKPGTKESRVRAAMVGKTASRCPQCNGRFLWELHTVRTYASTSQSLRPRPANLALGGE